MDKIGLHLPNNMGENIEIYDKNAIRKGVPKLVGKKTKAWDLRGGAALELAGRMAEGETIVEDINHIERGYQDFDLGLRLLSAKIEKR